MEPREFQREAFRTVRELQTLLHSLSTPILKKYNLTFQQLAILVELDGNRFASVADLSEILGVPQTSIASQVRKLKARGLVQRYRDQRNKRSHSVCLSIEGKDLMDAIDAESSEIFFTFMATMPRDIFEAVISGMYAIRLFMRGLVGVESHHLASEPQNYLGDGDRESGENSSTSYMHDDYVVSEQAIEEAVQEFLADQEHGSNEMVEIVEPQVLQDKPPL